MKHVRMIRHGESTANAGAASKDHASIPLTMKGLEQAHVIASGFHARPDLIISSPFTRAKATADAAIARFPMTATEIWPIQEFTYLAPGRCINTTVADRKAWVDEYWAKADPAYVHGEGAESFVDFIQRVQVFLDRLAGAPGNQVAVFSHGQFMSALAWLLVRQPTCIYSEMMLDWRAYDIENHIENGWGYSITEAPDCTWSMGHVLNPHGVPFRDGEAMSVCGTMLLYAGKLHVEPEGSEAPVTDQKPDQPTFL